VRSHYFFVSHRRNAEFLRMALLLVDCFWLIVVAAVWGATNPLLKRGGQGITAVKQRNAVLQFIAELCFLFLNWRYMLPFLLNQSGSVIYYLTLATVDLSIAVPLTNSLTFIFTGLAGRYLGEQVSNKGTYLGALLVVIGVTLCIYSKVS